MGDCGLIPDQHAESPRTSPFGPCPPILPPRPPLRNGMDHEPTREEKACNPPDVRSWQMSPFGRERFDLNEIQQAEKMGFKFRFEAKRLKELYFGGGVKIEVPKPKPKVPCEVCTERQQEEEKQKRRSRFKSKLMYQPYGPSSCLKDPEASPYKVLGPSIFTCYQYKDLDYCKPKFSPCDYSPYGPL